VNHHADHVAACSRIVIGLLVLTGCSVQFEVILPPLASLVWAVRRSHLKGGALLDLLHAKSHSGVPPLQACMQRSAKRTLCWTSIRRPVIASRYPELF
jgi:hypothetical protein